MEPFFIFAVLAGGAICYAVYDSLLRTVPQGAIVKRLPRALVGAARPGLVHVRGRVVLDRSIEPLEAPLAGAGVFVRVHIERLEHKTGGGRGGATSADVVEASMSPEWTPLHKSDRCVPFLLDDGSGVLAVDLEGAKVLPDRRVDVVSRPEAPDARVLELARAHMPDEPLDGWVLRLTVETFAEGDEISVLGLAEEVAGTTSIAPYRGGATPPRLRVVRPPDERPMFASHGPLTELAESGRINAAE